MTELLPLLQVQTEPSFWLWRIQSVRHASTAMLGWSEARLVVRTARGRKMRHWSGVDDEFAAALQFPWYFGENWAALAECITDLGWLPPDAGYVIVLTDPHLILEGNPDDFAVLVRLLTGAIAEWATPVELGEWWDRPAVPFNVVLAVHDAETAGAQQRWIQAGARVATLR